MKGTAVKSGAQDDGQRRTEETAATLIGTSRIFMLPPWEYSVKSPRSPKGDEPSPVPLSGEKLIQIGTRRE